MDIKYKTGKNELFSQVKPLWEKQRDFHAEISAEFSEFFLNQNFTNRRKEIEEKAHGDKLLVILAYDEETDENIGYCMAVMDCKDVGEIESIYVREAYRKNGVAKQMMDSAITWMNKNGAKEKILVVASGNEEVIGFYKGFGFRPFSIKLKETK